MSPDFIHSFMFGFTLFFFLFPFLEDIYFSSFFSPVKSFPSLSVGLIVSHIRFCLINFELMFLCEYVRLYLHSAALMTSTKTESKQTWSFIKNHELQWLLIWKTSHTHTSQRNKNKRKTEKKKNEMKCYAPKRK